MSYYIIENTKSEKVFKCPFCKFHGTKEQIVLHVDKVHNDMIPEKYTAARVVFNHFNKKEVGHCVICGKETEWNEEKWRYERFCTNNNDKCKNAYVKDFKKVRMVNKYGVEHKLNDPEQQKLMLSRRSISGTYKFKDNGVRSYCGSYELKALEFYDKVLGVPSSDIMTPGPTFEYEYKGKKHQWITDIFYIPLMLVHDVKDGGSNPNNRDMKDYREKQEAKEAMIKSLDKYNYIRLTDNNFEQLLYIMSDIKYSMFDPDSNNKHKIHINESLAATMGTLPPSNSGNELFLIQYDKGLEGDGYALSNDRYLSKMFIINNDSNLQLESYHFLHKANYSVYKYDTKETPEIWGKVLSDYSSKAFIRTKDYFYNKMTKKQMLSPDQIDYDNKFIEEKSVYDTTYDHMHEVLESIRNEFSKAKNSNTALAKEKVLTEFAKLNIIDEFVTKL